MPFVPATFNDRLSDLIVHENDPSVGFSRRDINVTPDGEIKIGTVVFRAKTGNLTAPFAAVSAAGDLSLDNEYAVVFGDHYSFNAAFTPRNIVAGQYNAVAIVGTGGGIQLKEYYIKQRIVDDAGLTEANLETLKGLLEAQGIQVLKTV